VKVVAEERKTVGFADAHPNDDETVVRMGHPEYVLDLCERVGQCSDGGPGRTRLFLGVGARRVQELLREEMEALGMAVRVDAAGNLRGVYAGAEPGAPVLLMGSHVDTVPNAGRYDGVLGVAVALGCVRALTGRRLGFAVEVVAFSEEEGIRFKLPYIGSRAVVGTLGAAELARVDGAGVSVAGAIEGFGLELKRLDEAVLTPGTVGYLEVHIEQGPVLEALGLPLGVVTAIAGQMQLEVSFAGRANHAGTTPMGLRQDALAAAAEWVGVVERYATGVAGLVATVGVMQVGPGAANVVPGSAVATLDVRHAEDAVRERAAAELVAAAERAGSVRAVAVTVRELSRQAAVAMDVGMVGVISEAVEAPGFGVHRMVSGAGHDAMILAGKVPAGMLFVRTPGGLSHHPDEAVAEEDVVAAMTAMMNVLEGLEMQFLRALS
jgi:allantoate deiminase